MRWGYDACGRRVILRGAAPAGLGAIQTNPFQWVQPQSFQWTSPPRATVAAGCSSEFPNKNCPGNVGSCCDQSCTVCSGFAPQSRYVAQPAALVSESFEAPQSPAPVYGGPEVTQGCSTGETEFNSDLSDKGCVRRRVDGTVVAGHYSCRQIETSYQSGRGGVYESPQINPIKYCCSCRVAGLPATF